MSETKIGMSEKQWLRNTVLSDLSYSKDGVKAYRSNRLFYYFQNGVLVKIDPGWIAAEKIAAMNRTAPMGASPDVYGELKKLDELRKEKIISEEEFQAQKKKVLER